MNVLDILDVKITVWDAELLQFPSYFVRSDRLVLLNKLIARASCLLQNRRLYLKLLKFSRYFFEGCCRRAFPIWKTAGSYYMNICNVNFSQRLWAFGNIWWISWRIEISWRRRRWLAERWKESGRV